MASKRTLRPRVYRLNKIDYRLDLRGKKFSGLLALVSGGKRSLQFSSRAEADRKALDEYYGQDTEGMVWISDAFRLSCGP